MRHRGHLALPLSLVMAVGLLAGTVTPVAAAPVPLSAVLSGSAEAPAAGDPDGSGTATVTVDPAAGTLCYTLQVAAIDAPTGAHIHEAAPGVAGPIQVTLTTPDVVTGASSDCADAGDYSATEVPPAAVSAFLTDLATNPQKYYVNVHTAAFPGGAVRGQLNNPRLCGTVTRTTAGVISIGATVVPAAAMTADVAAQLAAAAMANASVCVDATYNASGTVLAATNVDATFSVCAMVVASGSGATRTFTVAGVTLPAGQLSASEAAALELALTNQTNACVNLVIADSVVTSVSGQVDVCVTVGARTATSIVLDGVTIPLGTGSSVAAGVTQGATLSLRVAVNDGAVTITTITLSGCAAPAAPVLPNTRVDAGSPASALLAALGALYLLAGGLMVLLPRRTTR